MTDQKHFVVVVVVVVVVLVVVLVKRRTHRNLELMEQQCQKRRHLLATFPRTQIIHPHHLTVAVYFQRVLR